jgi:NADPH:quinone reductase-like Zn-dependent oxidoreductase
MKAARVLRIGPPNVITNDDPPQPEPALGQLLVRVKAAAACHKKQSTLTLKGVDNEQDVIFSLTSV